MSDDLDIIGLLGGSVEQRDADFCNLVDEKLVLQILAAYPEGLDEEDLIEILRQWYVDTKIALWRAQGYVEIDDDVAHISVSDKGREKYADMVDDLD